MGQACAPSASPGTCYLSDFFYDWDQLFSGSLQVFNFYLHFLIPIVEVKLGCLSGLPSIDGAMELVLGSRVLSLWMEADEMRWGSRQVEEIKEFSISQLEDSQHPHL